MGTCAHEEQVQRRKIPAVIRFLAFTIASVYESGCIFANRKPSGLVLAGLRQTDSGTSSPRLRNTWNSVSRARRNSNGVRFPLCERRRPLRSLREGSSQLAEQQKLVS